MRYLLLLLALSFSLQASEINFRKLSFKEGLAAAAKEGKPVFVDCFTTWCGPCKWMSANIFTDDAVAKYYNENYVCLKIDMEKGEGIDIAKRYGIRAYPTLLYLDSEGEQLLVSVGAARNPQDYIDAGEQAKDPERNLVYLKANKEDNFENLDFMSLYFETMSKANMVHTPEVEAFFQQFPTEQWLKPQLWEILQNVADDPNSSVFQEAYSQYNNFVARYESDAEAFFDRGLFYGLANRLYRARNEEQKQAYQELKQQYLVPNHPATPKLRFRLSLLEAEKEKDWQKYGLLAMEGTEKFFNEAPTELNSVAWNVYEKVEDAEILKSAEKWAARAVELDGSHHILDTYAHLLAKNGKTDQALKWELKAFELAQAEGANTEAYQKLIDELSGSSDN